MKSVFSAFLCIVQLCTVLMIFPAAQSAYAAAVPRSLRLSQAQHLALSNCRDIAKIINQIFLKRMKFTESVARIRADARNKQTLRWTPLLSFKLPEKLDLVEEFELTMKPIVLMQEITSLQHKMNDLRFNAINNVNKAFFNVYVLQEKIAFTEVKLELAELELARNTARLAVGSAKLSDIETMEGTVESLVEELAQLKRNFHSAKVDLSDIIKLDVSTGYRFMPPLSTADFTREHLEWLTNYTLANDHTFYQLRMDESIELMNLNEYERLMRKQYGSHMDRLTPFINTARSGNSIDAAAFRIAYDGMITAVDQPWAGRIRILFFSFSREFLKGQISGARYIEDETYALITASMEYVAARKDRENAERDLIKQVAAEFEALITARNSMLSLMRTQENTRIQLDRVALLNKTGKAEYEEVKEKLDDYQAIQLDVMEALKEYNDLLSNFDRLTCGAVTLLLQGMDLDPDAGEGGLSLPGDVIYYYIYADVADMTFVFGLDVPEDFVPEVTHFEIWYEGNRIGERTPVTHRLRHLQLVYGDSDELTVRVFDGDDFVDQAVIDTTVPRAPLPVERSVRGMEDVEVIIGSYKVRSAITGEVSISTLTLEFNASANVGFYRIVYGENNVYSSEPVKFDESFTYLTLLIAALDDVKILAYDDSGEEIFEARFNTADQSIRRTVSVMV
jgi:hypothetical protein